MTFQRIPLNLLKRLIIHLSPKQSNLAAAFAYGSVAFPQHNRPNSKSSSLLDLVLIVRDPVQWHLDNIHNNPSHYSGLLRWFGDRDKPSYVMRSLLTQFPGPQVYYNPFVTWADPSSQQPINFKYGVVSLHNVLKDLRTWSYLFLAGRLHKPVMWINPDKPDDSVPDCVQEAQQMNLASALSYAILQMKPQSTIPESELYKSIAAISYTGDWRMTVAEDRDKIANLVTGPERLSRFRKLYSSILDQYIIRSDSNQIHLSMPSNHQDLVRKLLSHIPDRVCLRATVSDQIKDPSSARERLTDLSHEQRQQLLNRTVVSTVRRSSISQTCLGFISAGPLRSLRYASKKVQKMLHSLRLTNSI